ncbi:hypothetical protein DPV74_04290 [Burkholderia sp. HAN2018]|nr:hypothetical protein [Burkholderia sp. HAN2018]
MLGEPAQPLHACIKTTHFRGQVGRGYNCARRVGASLSGARSDPRMTPGMRQQRRYGAAAC